ncbi:hypothetical protein MSTE_02022 [Mycobacteroides stephanolepidis]|uniref:HEPN AbiU2-like domain-containing protein n=1 Tax=[Mycobacterium] stephanolepidis TaxID=1520670 RepID=A0A1Z4EWJ8_9MYCO|nr:hypothetical protein [[Mycobacterium] stephanolepidis]BAX97338.1 hypothetical protein MSTE_02022 [[Mycobacterium] stephanolepidis]
MRGPNGPGHPPSEPVIAERLRTEATNWINGVSLQSSRIAQAFRNRHSSHVDFQALEIDLHFFLIAVFRLRRCVERVSNRVRGLSVPLTARVGVFDDAIPSLRRLRNVSEHIDEYNLDEGRDSQVSRIQVQTWYLDTAEGGGLIWGWLGERLDVEQTHEAALLLYRGFLADVDTWIGTARAGSDSLSADHPADTSAMSDPADIETA